MATAVVRMEIDPDGRLTETAYVAALGTLEAEGWRVIASPIQQQPERRRLIEFVVDEPAGEREALQAGLAARCAEVFGVPAAPGTVTYISRGTDLDAHDVLARFRIGGAVRRDIADGSDRVTVALMPADLTRVPESRLRTALEAALNCEVRIVVE